MCWHGLSRLSTKLLGGFAFAPGGKLLGGDDIASGIRGGADRAEVVAVIDLWSTGGVTSLDQRSYLGIVVSFCVLPSRANGART